MEIILIGPIAAGKSTIGELLAKELSLPQVSMDNLRFDYYKEIGYDEALAKSIRESEGMWGLLRYWKPFEAHAVERLLADHQNCIIDFGAGHSVYEDNGLFTRVQKALAPYKNIFLLLPSPDPDESIAILSVRDEFLRETKPDINEHFVRHRSNYELATHIVYNEGKTPQETCEEIIRLIVNE